MIEDQPSSSSQIKMSIEDGIIIPITAVFPKYNDKEDDDPIFSISCYTSNPYVKTLLKMRKSKMIDACPKYEFFHPKRIEGLSVATHGIASPQEPADTLNDWPVVVSVTEIYVNLTPVHIPDELQRLLNLKEGPILGDNTIDDAKIVYAKVDKTLEIIASETIQNDDQQTNKTEVMRSELEKVLISEIVQTEVQETIGTKPMQSEFRDAIQTDTWKRTEESRNVENIYDSSITLLPHNTTTVTLANETKNNVDKTIETEIANLTNKPVESIDNISSKEIRDIFLPLPHDNDDDGGVMNFIIDDMGDYFEESKDDTYSIKRKDMTPIINIVAKDDAILNNNSAAQPDDKLSSMQNNDVIVQLPLNETDVYKNEIKETEDIQNKGECRTTVATKYTEENTDLYGITSIDATNSTSAAHNYDELVLLAQNAPDNQLGNNLETSGDRSTKIDNDNTEGIETTTENRFMDSSENNSLHVSNSMLSTNISANTTLKLNSMMDPSNNEIQNDGITGQEIMDSEMKLSATHAAEETDIVLSEKSPVEPDHEVSPAQTKHNKSSDFYNVTPPYTSSEPETSTKVSCAIKTIDSEETKQEEHRADDEQQTQVNPLDPNDIVKSNVPLRKDFLLSTESSQHTQKSIDKQTPQKQDEIKRVRKRRFVEPENLRRSPRLAKKQRVQYFPLTRRMNRKRKLLMLN